MLYQDNLYNDELVTTMQITKIFKAVRAARRLLLPGVDFMTVEEAFDPGFLGKSVNMWRKYEPMGGKRREGADEVKHLTSVLDTYKASAKTGVNPHNGENSPLEFIVAREILSYTPVVLLQRQSKVRICELVRSNGCLHCQLLILFD